MIAEHLAGSVMFQAKLLKYVDQCHCMQMQTVLQVGADGPWDDAKKGKKFHVRNILDIRWFYEIDDSKEKEL